MENIFDKIYKENLWASPESKSGSGSEVKNTTTLMKELKLLIEKYQINSMLDIPCGDYNWMFYFQWYNLNIEYIGADRVEQLIQDNMEKYPGVNFQVMDIITSDLPKVDLVFVRDCFGHLSNENVLKALENVAKSGSKYLLATSFTRWDKNPDIVDGGWKCINLMIPPFSLVPIALINEDCQEGYPHYNDKCMLLFKLN